MSRLPLYEANQTPKLTLPAFHTSKTYNSGLRFNKFCNQWQADWTLKLSSSSSNNPKLDWINKFTNPKQPHGQQSQLNALIKRRNKLVERQAGVENYFKTQGAFTTGMGNPHPVENGFTWHHILGTPYLTGSSVKGMVRAWCEQWLDDEDFKDETQEIACKRIFGSDKESKDNNTGSVVFHDVIPAAPVRLKAEIMTPHYSEYYQSAENDITPPGDWLNPIPIPFLAVEKEQMFHFMITPRTSQYKADTEQCMQWLKDALQYTGAGAKTASGYGYFEEHSLAMSWIEKETKDICKNETMNKEQKIFRARFQKALADRWQEIEDENLKKEVFDKLKEYWEQEGYWEAPPKGSSRKAKEIYAAFF